MLLEKDLTAATLIRDIDEILLDAQTLQNMKLAAGQLGIPDAANKLYEVMNKLVKITLGERPAYYCNKDA